MDGSELLNMIKARRSTRSWTKQDVEAEMIRQIFEAGAYAPTGANFQKTRLQLIENTAVIEQICLHTSDWFYKVRPNKIIAVYYDLSKDNPGHINYKEPHYWWKRLIWQDTAAAIQNMSLMAEGLGLKTCWVSLRPDGPHTYFLEEEVLKVSNYLMLTSFLFIGYSNEQPDINTFKHQGMPINKDLKEIILPCIQ